MSDVRQSDYTSEFKNTYEVQEYIGAGAFGTVYKCKQIRFHNVDVGERVVAVKLIEFQQKEENKIQNEINLLRRLHHPNIIRIYKSWVEYPPPRFRYPDRSPLNKTSKGAIFIETEFCDLESLRDWFQQEWRQKEHAKIFLYQILLGLKYLHDNEIIHRDMKPDNILLRKDASSNLVTAKICDFGISREISTFMTSRLGTYGYMSPEVLNTRKYTKKADVYAVGVMFYEMLVLSEKQNEDMSSLLAGMMLNEDTNYKFQFLSEADHLISSEERTLILSMVEVNAEKRRSADEIIKLLCKVYMDIKTSTIMRAVNISEIKLKKQNCLNYLRAMPNFKTISGIFVHNLDSSDKWVESVEKMTGVSPGIISAYMPSYTANEADWTSFIEKIISKWNNHHLVRIVRKGNPHTDINNFNVARGTNPGQKKWGQLINDGGRYNKVWKEQLDRIAPHLRKLQTAGVITILDILPILNDKDSTWGGHPGVNGTAKLYKLTHDYLTKHHNLTSFIWTWSLHCDYLTHFEQFWPGNDYVDVASVYMLRKNELPNYEYQRLINIVGEKPVSMEYMFNVPRFQLLSAQPRWTWFTADVTLLENTNNHNVVNVKTAFNSPSVINRGRIAFFNDY